MVSHNCLISFPGSIPLALCGAWEQAIAAYNHEMFMPEHFMHALISDLIK